MSAKHLYVSHPQYPASGGESEKDAQTDEETWPALPYSQSNPLSQDKGYDENIQLRA
jgi:hypothetical protein